MALAESDDFVETAHIVEYFVIKLGGFTANIPTETAYRRGEEFRQHDADGQVRDDQRDSDRRAQRKQCDRVKHGGRDGDDNRRNGVRKEDFQQFDVGGDQRDQSPLPLPDSLAGARRRSAANVFDRNSASRRKATLWFMYCSA